MKQQFSAKFWIEKHDDETINIGLSQEFLDGLGIIWNLAPKKWDVVEMGRSFLSLESSKLLMSLRSPISGNVMKWNEEVLNQPNSITGETYLLRIKPCVVVPVMPS